MWRRKNRGPVLPLESTDPKNNAAAISTMRPARILLLSVFFGIIILNIWNTRANIAASFQNDGFDQPKLSSHSQSTSSTNGNVNSNDVRICPARWDFYPNNEINRTFLEELYWKAHGYHNVGGNLEAMEKFLNKALDYTYEIRGFTPFVFNDEEQWPKSKETSISEQIKAQLRKEDTGSRGGYTQRDLPGKFTGPGATKHLMTDDHNGRMTNVMEPMSQERWDISIGPMLPQDSCLGYHVIEGPPSRRYEDKYICGWERGSFLTKTHKSNEESCHIVSIGSNDQWGFEEGIVANTNCNVATFDCTIHNPKHKPKTDRVKFHRSCISATSENYEMNGRSYMGYFDLLDMAGFVNADNNGSESLNNTGEGMMQPQRPTKTTRINYMKMDVEGYEYGVLTNMLRQARSRNLWHLLPDQLQIEFHYATWMYDLGWSMRTRDVGELSAFFGMLFREGGYMAVHVDVSVWPSLREVLFLRMYC